MRHRITFSQFGEDIIIARFLNRIHGGFYVDVGAHHPFHLSNTAMLHMMGWNGINIEPSPASYASFKRLRPHATNLNIAIHNELSEVELFQFKGGRINTIIEKRSENQKRGKEFLKSVKVKAMSLNKALEKHLPRKTAIDFLNVDIEGYDFECLKAFDFKKYRPKVCCIECHGFTFKQINEHETVKLMYDNGYDLMSVNVFTFCFVDPVWYKSTRVQKTEE